MIDCDDNMTVICLGSNVAGREANMAYALGRIRSVCGDCISSGVYENDDESGLGAPYLNMVVKCRCGMSLGELRALAKRLEADCGRVDASKPRGEMPLDVDIVVYEGNVVDSYEFARPYFLEGYRRVSFAVAT